MIISSSKISLGDADIIINNLNDLHQNNYLTETPHMHSDVEIHFIFSGTATMIINGEAYQLKKHTSLLVPKNSMHFSRNCSQDFKALSFCFSIKQNNSKRISGEFFFYSSVFSTEHASIIKTSYEDRRYIDTIIKIISNYDVNLVRKLEPLVTVLLIDIGHVLSQSAKISAPIINNGSSHYVTTRKMLIEQFVYAKVSHDITLTDLSNYLSLSNRQTIRFIKQEFGIPLHELVTKACMIEAKNMIIQNKLSLIQIANRLGYHNYSTFYAAYKKFYGITPQQTIASNKVKTS